MVAQGVLTSSTGEMRNGPHGLGDEVHPEGPGSRVRNTSLASQGGRVGGGDPNLFEGLLLAGGQAAQPPPRPRPQPPGNLPQEVSFSE